MPELRECAFIRELHVLGNHLNVGSVSDDNTSQHRGYGKRLIAKAEEIAKANNFKKIVIIAGVGVRDYYRKQGYYLENTFMVKKLVKEKSRNYNNYMHNMLLDLVGIVVCDVTYSIFQLVING